uniref:Uncharacterized protein n=1 Tax=Glossina palpalis gambiensis TaxID=67801 RepID=A0A1B0C3W3_9MUSC
MQQRNYIYQNSIYSSFEAINKAESQKLLRARAKMVDTKFTKLTLRPFPFSRKATTTTITDNKVTSPLVRDSRKLVLKFIRQSRQCGRECTHTPSNTITLDSSWPSEVSQHMLSVWPPMATSSCSSIKYGVVDDNISDTTLSFVKSSSCWLDCGLCNGVVNNNSLMMATVGFSHGSGRHFRSRSGGACAGVGGGAGGGDGVGVVDDIIKVAVVAIVVVSSTLSLTLSWKFLYTAVVKNSATFCKRLLDSHKYSCFVVWSVVDISSAVVDDNMLPRHHLPGRMVKQPNNHNSSRRMYHLQGILWSYWHSERNRNSSDGFMDEKINSEHFEREKDVYE